MSKTIAEKVKENKKHKPGSLKEKDIRVRGGRVPLNNEVSIAIRKPANYPAEKFLFDRLYGIYQSNSKQFSKNGNGKEARYCADLNGNGGRFFVNVFELFQHYPEYDWMNILRHYPNNVKSSKAVRDLLTELEVCPISYYSLCFFFRICILSSYL